MPMPGAGRYIVTALDQQSMHTAARKVSLDVRSTEVDIDVP